MVRNTTTPEARVGWVSATDGRGTADILWSCFSILLVCTWSCLHLNVPSVAESEAGWLKWYGIPYWPERPLFNKWIRKVRWMAIIVIAPEYGVMMAVSQYLSAKISITETENLEMGPMQGDSTSEQNVGLANSKAETIEKDVGTPKLNIKRQKFTMSHALCANMGGFKVKIWYEGQESRQRYEGIILKYEGLKTLYQISKDFEIPSEEDVKGLGKSDVFSKAFACVQSTWLVIQCIARASAGLHITQLELATIAFVTCGILMYLLWWNKPFGLERRELIIATVDSNVQFSTFKESILKIDGLQVVRVVPPLDNNKTLADLRHIHISDDPQGSANLFKEDIIAVFRIIYRTIGRPLGLKANRFYPTIGGGVNLALLFSGTLFSAVHVFAWNFSFPSAPIQIAWRAFSVLATSAAPIFLFFLYTSDYLDNECLEIIAGAVAICCLVFYLLARIGLIVLMFVCFYSMPVSVYETVKWTKFLPHFS